ncbi:integrating conjugative element protein [Janthinobacterium sp. BJB446]|uniref:integrating conjugative element protein n=1 Tax=Janthinobacterium sp. BJB446 TaxID=2048009 RepID=UPI000C0EE6E4|nr:integrating conjugative element protein [Janthinobacterium sp. BJB446]PHV19188.1 integrating conjugative element protein [Janthinobacterium sp. BJB446]
MNSFYQYRMFIVLVAVCAGATSAMAQTQDVPRSQSQLYYRIGGSAPAARSPNPNALAVKMGFGIKLNANYTCGKFDVGLSWANLMNGFSSLGTQITGAVKAGISALPLYVLQRAQPGLYELFQTYAKKAEISVNAALDSCEQMEAQIKQGKDPYAKWVGLAKGEGWSVEAGTNTDVVSAKSKVEADNGRKGVTWIGNKVAGGFTQPAIRPVNDIVVAGYNLTMMQPVTASNTANYSTGGTPLGKVFPRPQDAADFAVSVLGDHLIATCDETSCAPKGVYTAIGLQPKYDAEIPAALNQVKLAISSSSPTYAALAASGAPDVSITTDVVRAIRELPADMQAISSERIAKEIALARTIEKALAVRAVLISGISLPEVQKHEPAVAIAKEKVDQLTQFIQDLLFESRVRREIVSDTAGSLLQAYQGRRAIAAPLPTQQPADKNIMNNGRVK